MFDKIFSRLKYRPTKLMRIFLGCVVIYFIGLMMFRFQLAGIVDKYQKEKEAREKAHIEESCIAMFPLCLPTSTKTPEQLDDERQKRVAERKGEQEQFKTLMNTNNWEQHTSEVLGFSFKAPPGARVGESKERNTLNVSITDYKSDFYTPIIVYVRPNPKRLSLKQWYVDTNKSDTMLDYVREVRVGPHQALTIRRDIGHAAPYYIYHGDEIIYVTLMESNPDAIYLQDDLIVRFVESIRF